MPANPPASRLAVIAAELRELEERRSQLLAEQTKLTQSEAHKLPLTASVSVAVPCFPDEKVALFLSLFACRTDVYPRPPHGATHHRHLRHPRRRYLHLPRRRFRWIRLARRPHRFSSRCRQLRSLHRRRTLPFRQRWPRLALLRRTRACCPSPSTRNIHPCPRRHSPSHASPRNLRPALPQPRHSSLRRIRQSDRPAATEGRPRPRQQYLSQRRPRPDHRSVDAPRWPCSPHSRRSRHRLGSRHSTV